MVGILTFDDVMDIAQEEVTEDFHKFGSVQEGVFNPLKPLLAFCIKKRIVWLLALVF